MPRVFKKLEESIKASVPCRSELFCYEPGNMTRYTVLMTECKRTDLTADYIVTVVNFKRSMEVARKLNELDIGYMHEKLDLGTGDCEALIPLINHFIEQAK